MATIATLMALLIVATAGASVIWMHILPGPDGDKGFYTPLGAYLIARQFYWPPYTAVVVGAVGLVALGASLSMWRALRRLQ